MTRGRDLQYRIITDLSEFVTDSAVRKLEDLADASTDTDRELENTSRTARDAADDLDRLGRTSRDLEDDLDKSGKAARDLADDVDTAADQIDDSFDAIDRSARTNLRRGLADHADGAKRSLKEVGGEAADVAREMGSSFDGSAESVAGAFQDLAANAGSWLGPIGIAAGAAAATGIGLIRAEQEKLSELTKDLVEEMLEAGGKLTDAIIDARVENLASEDPAGFVELRDQADRLGISFRDLARAKAGDGEAAERLMGQIDTLRGTIITADDANRVWADGSGAADLELLKLERTLQTTATAYGLATEATQAVTEATGEAARGAGIAGGAWDDLRGNMRTPITAKVNVSAPSSGELQAIRQRMANAIGSITVPINGSVSTAGGLRARW